MFLSLGMSAQNVETKAAYKYEFVVNLDKNAKAIERLDAFGIVLFAQAAGARSHICNNWRDRNVHRNCV